MVALFFCLYFFQEDVGTAGRKSEQHKNNTRYTIFSSYFGKTLSLFLPKYTYYFVYLSYKSDAGRSHQPGVFLGVIFLLYL